MLEERSIDEKKKFFLNEFKDFLLAEPFSDEGRRLIDSCNADIDSEEFFDVVHDADANMPEYKYFVELYDKVSEHSGYDESVVIEPIPTDLEGSIISDGDNDYILMDYKNDLMSFEGDVMKTTSPVLTITGTKGSGKTTYLHFLKNKCMSNNLVFHILDITNPKEKIDFLKGQISFEEEMWNDSVWRVTIQLAELTSQLICAEKRASLKTVFLNWKHQICKCFYEYISKNIRDDNVVKFFKLLEWSVFNETDEELGCKELIPFFEEILKNPTGAKNLLDARQKSLSYILQIINCLMICLSRDGKRYICAIDNIEYLLDVKNDVIVNEKDLELLIDSFFSSLDKVSSIQKELKSNLNAYTFLLATRPSSLSFVRRNAQSRIQDSESKIHITIKNAVRFEAVVEKRIKNMPPNIKRKCINNEYVNMLKIIINDKSISAWGMYSVISKMCNYNYIQIIGGLVKLISSESINEVKFFCNSWRYVNDKRKSHENTEKKANMKHFLRKKFRPVQ